MANAPPFQKIKHVDPLINRIQDNIDAVVSPLTRSVNSTPLSQGTLPQWNFPDPFPTVWERDSEFGDQDAISTAFLKDALLFVHVRIYLKVLVTAGAASPFGMFTLPKGYLPAVTMLFPALQFSSGTSITGTFIEVFSDGDVTWFGAPTNGDVICCNFSYLAEN